ncbi:DDE-type integrase/transposase/recombinase [Cellulomonas sp. C5510]|uniref:DDE-type integrase/transposase/recombinase n=1 Tax=Cellulomonas sp. C5510 TaxID=2871170 RepID=UPI001C9808C5|nr:DDE-type integrase/transposase/recombinase [Cellulomonas sp. C5510]QZN84875.1 DDE-type integrase/transposase/recombinase [Cellulomonas sp. C5510]
MFFDRKKGRGLAGAHKVWHLLRREGITVARCTVERLMRELGQQGVRRGKRFVTTRPEPGAARPGDHVQRLFAADRPDQLWVVDFTYVPTWSGMAFTAFVTDVFSRRIVGWRTADRMPTELPLDALEMALWVRDRAGRDVEGVIHHSDAGSQGGFNRSSQHLELVEVFDGSSAAGSGSGGAPEAAVPGAPEVPARGRGRVLDRDRQGAVAHRGRGRDRCVAARGSAVVPQRWRHATVRPQVAPLGPLPVLC